MLSLISLDITKSTAMGNGKSKPKGQAEIEDIQGINTLSLSKRWIQRMPDGNESKTEGFERFGCRAFDSESDSDGDSDWVESDEESDLDYLEEEWDCDESGLECSDDGADRAAICDIQSFSGVEFWSFFWSWIATNLT